LLENPQTTRMAYFVLKCKYTQNKQLLDCLLLFIDYMIYCYRITLIRIIWNEEFYCQCI